MYDGRWSNEREKCVFCRKRSLFVGHWNGQSTNKTKRYAVMFYHLFGIHMLFSWAARVKHNMDFIFYIKFSSTIPISTMCYIEQ